MPMPKGFNLKMYKFHAIGDYEWMITQFGTTDSYTTQIVCSTVSLLFLHLFISYQGELAHVTEFVPLHDIPYILLSPDGGPYFSIDEFLASPDRNPDISTCIPDASHF